MEKQKTKRIMKKDKDNIASYFQAMEDAIILGATAPEAPKNKQEMIVMSKKDVKYAQKREKVRQYFKELEDKLAQGLVRPYYYVLLPQEKEFLEKAYKTAGKINGFLYQWQEEAGGGFDPLQLASKVK